MKFFTAVTWLLFVIIATLSSVKSHCCHATTIKFKPYRHEEKMSLFDWIEWTKKSETCGIKNSYASFSFFRSVKTCKVQVCDDGEPHDNFYCSNNGTCNIFGCDCSQPCYSNDKNLDAKEMFELKYGYLVTVKDA